MPKTIPDTINGLISEKDFQAAVRELAELMGWTVFCTWSSRHSPGGEPDLRLVHPIQKRMIWMELKSAKGKLTARQVEAIETLQAAGEEVYVFRPQDWEQIEKILSGREGG